MKINVVGDTDGQETFRGCVRPVFKESNCQLMEAVFVASRPTDDDADDVLFSYLFLLWSYVVIYTLICFNEAVKQYQLYDLTVQCLR